MSATSPARPGGLIGGLGRLKGIFMHESRIAMLLVMFAGVITILKKNYTPDDIWSYAMWFGVAIGLAALHWEMRYAKKMADAWFNARPGALLGAFCIWAFAFGFALNQWVGAASESQSEKSNLHKAAHTLSQTVTEVEKAAKKRYDDAVAVHDRIEGKGQNGAANVKPWRSVSDARAIVDAAKAKWQWESSKGCTQEAKNTRKVCAEYRSAKADLDRWDELATAKKAVGEAEAEWNEARKTMLGTKTEASATRSDMVVFTRFFGMTEEAAQVANGILAIIAISIFLSTGSFSLRLDELKATGRRQKWSIGAKLYRAYYRIVHGGEPPNLTINQYGTMNGLTREDFQQAAVAGGLRL